MRDLVIVLLVGAGTYGMRSLFIVAGGGRRLGARTLLRLRHARHAVLAALTVGFLSSAQPVQGGLAVLAAGAAVIVLPRRPLAPLAIGLAAAFLVSGL